MTKPTDVAESPEKSGPGAKPDSITPGDIGLVSNPGKLFGVPDVQRASSTNTNDTKASKESSDGTAKPGKNGSQGDKPVTENKKPGSRQERAEYQQKIESMNTLELQQARADFANVQTAVDQHMTEVGRPKMRMVSSSRATGNIEYAYLDKKTDSDGLTWKIRVSYEGLNAPNRETNREMTSIINGSKVIVSISANDGRGSKQLSQYEYAPMPASSGDGFLIRVIRPDGTGYNVNLGVGGQYLGEGGKNLQAALKEVKQREMNRGRK